VAGSSDSPVGVGQTPPRTLARTGRKRHAGTFLQAGSAILGYLLIWSADNLLTLQNIRA